MRTPPATPVASGHATGHAHDHACGPDAVKDMKPLKTRVTFQVNDLVLRHCERHAKEGLSAFMRDAIDNGTVVGMGKALMSRVNNIVRQETKKTVSLDQRTRALLNEISTMTGLSVEETARLLLEAYVDDVAGGVLSARRWEDYGGAGRTVPGGAST